MLNKLFVMSSGLLLNTAVFAGGCADLKQSVWVGQANLVSQVIVPIKISITDVVKVEGSNFFKLNGTLNGEPINGMFGCMEMTQGRMSHLSIDSQSSSLMNMDFYPNAANPTKLLNFGGMIKNVGIDTTTESSKNYLIRR